MRRGTDLDYLVGLMERMVLSHDRTCFLLSYDRGVREAKLSDGGAGDTRSCSSAPIR